MVTPRLINAAIDCVANRGVLYVQSNVEDVAVFMKQITESCAEARNDVYLKYTNKLNGRKDSGCLYDINREGLQSTSSHKMRMNDSKTEEEQITKRSKAYHASGRELAEGRGWYDQGTSPLALQGRTETEETGKLIIGLR